MQARAGKVDSGCFSACCSQRHSIVILLDRLACSCFDAWTNLLRRLITIKSLIRLNFFMLCDTCNNTRHVAFGSAVRGASFAIDCFGAWCFYICPPICIAVATNSATDTFGKIASVLFVPLPSHGCCIQIYRTCHRVEPSGLFSNSIDRGCLYGHQALWT